MPKRSSGILPGLMMIFFLLSMPLFSGCGGSDAESKDFGELLEKDGIAALKGAYAEEYARLTIIRGALNKFIVNPQNTHYLGIATGALEAAVFPEEYELKRFNQLENLSADMRKEIISQPLLSITLKKREVLNHIYRSVFKPLLVQLDDGKPVGSRETGVLNELVILLDSLTRDYSVLADKSISFQSAEARQAFYSVQNNLREMQKLQLVEQKFKQKSD